MKIEKEIKELYKEEKEKVKEFIKEKETNEDDKKRETVSGKERIELQKEQIEKGDYDKDKDWELIR